MENTTEEQIIISEVKNSEVKNDEEEKRLKAEDSRKQLKAILTFGIILTGFLTFTYFFFNYIEEKAEEYKQQQQQEMQKTNKS
ncbi:hypothetical protein A3305_01005 [Rickettsia amblyommatis]|uniref:RP671a family tick cell line-upregulated protein n=1 Tax=Rickettsia amblyommatis TaxID=33989 RepID=UPI0009C0974E|nr:hypothetical protein [Rickettsia amblyommatis]ARD87190.1 hypothetical protein A3305_01005 [Rickettsia amblyommatis]